MFKMAQRKTPAEYTDINELRQEMRHLWAAICMIVRGMQYPGLLFDRYKAMRERELELNG